LINKNVGINRDRENTKSRILDLIAEHNDKLTTYDLSKLTGFHRDTIHSNCKELMEKDGYIKKTGRKGTYYLTLKAFTNPNLKGLNLVREFTKSIRNNKFTFTPEEQQRILRRINDKYLEIKQNLDKGSKEITDYEHYNNTIQQELISYSVLMGAYTTYVFLQALNPDKWIFLENGKKWEKGMSSLTEQEKDEVIRLWIKNSINPSYLFTIFKKLNVIKRNENDFDRLIKSYEKVFPDLYKQFEDINRKMNEPDKEELEDYDSEGYYESLKRKGNKT
jgi:hypothetical protein